MPRDHLRTFDPDSRRILAGEYVLGLLRGGARRRLERYMREDPELSSEIAFWERHLAAWNRVVKPIPPPERVWKHLNAQVTLETRSYSPQWPVLRLAAAVALLVLGVIVGRYILAPTPTPTYLAMMSTGPGRPSWVVTVQPQKRYVHMTALANDRPPSGKSYELWLLPKQGAPIPMGLMNPTGVASETVSATLMAALHHAKGLAISLEPRGGSPTGKPTGPIVALSPILST